MMLRCPNCPQRRRNKPRRDKPGIGVLAQKERQSSMLEEIQNASKKRQRCALFGR